MKTLNFLRMGFLLSGLALVACESGGENGYQPQQKMQAKTEYSDDYVQLLSFEVKARSWSVLSGTDRYVQVPVPAITDKIIKDGSVILYLNEADKHLSLPFTYYQVRRALSFQPSYEKGCVYVNILGNFILSIHASYTFRVLIINEEAINHFKNLNWYNYEEVKRALKLKQNLPT